MFDKLDDLLLRYDELLNELHEPSVADDPARLRRLMKEQSDLQPLSTPTTNTKNANRKWRIPWSSSPARPTRT